MRLLLDTHAAVWWWTNDARLPEIVRSAIADPGADVLVSAVVAWEIAHKFRLGKWPDVGSIVAGFGGVLARSRFSALAVEPSHALLAGSLEGAHRDPFDRLLAAQAIAESLVLVSNDAAMTLLGARVFWTTALH